MKKEELQKRTKSFAHNCVKLVFKLPNNYLANHIKSQLIRCSTSIAANYRSVCLAQSKASFVSKLSIVLEEADESEFWLDFIIDEKLMSESEVEQLKKKAHELVSIFAASRLTARKG